VALVSQQYAKRRGISQAAVWKRTAAAGGPIPTHGPRKLIDPAEADALWDATRTEQGEAGAEATRAAGAGATAALIQGETLARAGTARLLADAQLKRLLLDQRRGTLISRDRAVLKAFAFARMLRDAWLTWPARVGPRLAAELGVEPAALVVALDDAVRTHLAELASERCEF
jgi:hypothetical protein